MTAVKALKIRIKTANVDKAGTNDPVWFDIGKRRWKLDNPGRDDFERGHEDVFDLPPGASLQDTDFWRVLMCKAADGGYGGWKLDGVTVLINGSAFYQKQGISSWLENEGTREWLAPDFTPVGSVPRSILVSESAIRAQLQAAVSQLSSSQLKPRGDLTVAVDFADIYVKQKFEADIAGPNPDVTMSVHFVPVIRDDKIEVIVSNLSVDVDYPWWAEAATGYIVTELVERHIERDLKSQLKARIKSVLQAKVDEAIPAGLAKQVCLRPNSVEVFI